MTTWFTSDTHFGHANIIKYANRPFVDVQAMDKVLVDNWNQRVRHDDTVYHLGDFTLSNAMMAHSYFAALNGKVKVLGNPWHHDSRWLPEPDPRNLLPMTFDGHLVEILPPMVVLELPEFGDGKHAQALVLCHYPLAVWDRKHYGAWHLYGHTHGTHQNGGLSFDVGVDSNGFYPVSLDGVARQMQSYAYGTPFMKAA